MRTGFDIALVPGLRGRLWNERHGASLLQQLSWPAAIAMEQGFFVSALVTLAVVVDPIGLVPSFIAVTSHLAKAAQRRVAVEASLIAGGILLAATLGGDWLLDSLSISLPAFRIAGGLLLLWIAFEMVFEKRLARQSRTAEQAQADQAFKVAAFPLALPLMAGPGALTATILLSARADSNPILLGSLVLAIILVIIGCMCSFLMAGTIGRLLGITGNVVLSRLLGILLAALAVQFVIDGVQDAASLPRL
jgi:multiple antibiotic resistance protein